MSTPQVRRGAGGDPGNPPLEQGQAATANRALEAAKQMVAQRAAPATTAAPAEAPAHPVAAAPDYTPGNELDKYVIRPTDRPQEHIAQGMVGSLPAPAPADLLDGLGVLGQVANQPGASARVQALYLALVNRFYASQ